MTLSGSCSVSYSNSLCNENTYATICLIRDLTTLTNRVPSANSNDMYGSGQKFVAVGCWLSGGLPAKAIMSSSSHIRVGETVSDDISATHDNDLSPAPLVQTPCQTVSQPAPQNISQISTSRISPTSWPRPSPTRCLPNTIQLRATGAYHSTYPSHNSRGDEDFHFMESKNQVQSTHFRSIQ
jgi:hypothetical protein